MADLLGINRSAVARHIKNLQAKGIIRRVDPDKGGHWGLFSPNSHKCSYILCPIEGTFLSQPFGDMPQGLFTQTYLPFSGKMCALAYNLLRNRIFHHEAICWDLQYVSCLHTNLTVVLGWMNANIPTWLAKIDSFDNVCESINKEMGWK